MVNNHQGPNNKLITVKEIISCYQLTYQTVNHYTDIGLLTVAFKKGNIRFFDREQVRYRLNVISRLARDGYSLRLIRRELLGV
ncbi:MAG: MerR family transcriptional regulator [Candidatus Omnitrophota bacterium]|nr:MerR family transcriptional regulator [Candidatus Omnitrophota bacterium]